MLTGAPMGPEKEEGLKNYEAKYFKEKIGDTSVYFSNWQEVPQELIEKIESIKKTNNYLDYKQGDTYIFSQINNKDKYSDNYLDCTGILLTGLGKNTGKRVSFMTHQDPSFFVENKENKKNFKEELDQEVDIFKDKCDQNSVHSIIFGGNLLKNNIKDPFDDESFVRGINDVEDVEKYFPDKYNIYQDSIYFLNFIVSKKMGTESVVALGPNDNWDGPDNSHGVNRHSLSAYFDNENNKLYLLGPTRTHEGSFEAGKIWDKIKEYKNDGK